MFQTKRALCFHTFHILHIAITDYDKENLVESRFTKLVINDKIIMAGCQ